MEYVNGQAIEGSPRHEAGTCLSTPCFDNRSSGWLIEHLAETYDEFREGA